jgi:hypothetical protein
VDTPHTEIDVQGLHAGQENQTGASSRTGSGPSQAKTQPAPRPAARARIASDGAASARTYRSALRSHSGLVINRQHLIGDLKRLVVGAHLS